LNGYTPQETVYVVDPADVTGSREVCHVEGLVGAVTGNTETSGNVLTGVWAALLRIAGERRTCAGNVYHLPL
jgi:hypothetical protein